MLREDYIVNIYGILRGYPGLGRVVSGLEILNHYKEHGHNIRLFTYFNGLRSAIDSEFEVPIQVSDRRDISSIGVIPVSATGENLITDIQQWKPDMILCDGEPLLIEALSVLGYRDKLIALLNPFDLVNPYTTRSSSLYFRTLYTKAEMLLVHGLWKIDNEYRKEDALFCSTHTIIRETLFNIKQVSGEKIVGVLGGGAFNCSKNFAESTHLIAKKIIHLANLFSDLDFELYCNEAWLAKSIRQIIGSNNIQVFEKYESPKRIYKNARLVISRAGRNTISELLYLGLPAIVIATDNNFRSSEQLENIRMATRISQGNIIGCRINEDDDVLNSLFESMLNTRPKQYIWQPGNEEAYNAINIFQSLL